MKILTPIPVETKSVRKGECGANNSRFSVGGQR